jgi:ubiquinone/menaquinone biosynthesis C-methylase UbiE
MPHEVTTPNSEAAMNAKTHWETVYEAKAADSVSWYQPHADRSLSLIRRISDGRASSVIDVGAGASTLVDDLLAAGRFNMSLLDLSEAAFAVVRQRLGAKSERVKWWVGDVTQVDLPPRAYDIWHDRAVFHFLTDASQRRAYVEQVRRAVKPGGHVIVAAFGPNGPLQCSGLPVMRYAADELHAEFGGAFELREHLIETHHTPAGQLQEFVYCHCVMH